MADIQKLNVNNTTYDISTTWTKVTGKPSTFPPSSHTHDGRYIKWGGSAADTNAMGWGTLTTANGYTILSHVSSSDGGDWGMVNKSGKIFMQLDGYYYQNEGRYRVLDTSDSSSFAPSSHIHDDRYYTESEIDTKLSGKSDTGHTHSQYLTSALRPAKFTAMEYYSDGYCKIRINNQVTSWLLSFDVKIFRYGDYTIRFSGFNQDMSESWYMTSASMIDGENSIEVKFGYGPTQYLWVAIPATPDMGISITNVANGFIPIDTYALDQLFTITYETELSGTVQETITLYPPSKEGHTHTKSQITDFPTSMPASDVYSWAKASTKPTYTYSEVGAAAASHTHKYAGSSSAGGAATSVVVADSNANSTYRMVWHSGNSLYSTDNIYCNPSTDYLYSKGFYQTSDERLKTFYEPIKPDLDKLSKLRKNYFKFNDKDKLEIGVSAQEIQSIYPEIVSTDDNGYLSVAYDKLSVIALAAIDELDNKYKKEINDLKDQLDAIKNILNEKGIV